MNNPSINDFEFEPLRVAVAKFSLSEGVNLEVAAAKIAGLALTGKLAAIGVKLPDPMQEEEPREDCQPIPPGAWTDFHPRDFNSGIIRVRIGNQLRALALWHDIQVAVAVQVAPTQTPPKRSRADTENAKQQATQHLIELRQSGAEKPGGSREGLRKYLTDRFRFTIREADSVMNAAKDKAPNDEWDRAGKKQF